MLGRKVFLASAVLSGGRLIIRFLDMIAALVVARFLTPADFGMVSLAVAALMLSRAITELPVSEALIRKPDLAPADVDTAFTLSLLRGLLVAGMLAAAAVPMGMIYNDDRLVPLLLALTVGPLAMALRSPQFVRFARNVNYTPDMLLDTGTRLVGFLSSIAVVLVTGSYWALVIGLVVPPLVAAPISYLVAPYRPRLSLASCRAILSFAGWLTLARFIATANAEVDRFFIGGILGHAAVGFFAIGRSVATTASWAIGTPLMQAMFPGFAKMQTDPDRLRSAYLKGQGILVATVMPLGFGLAVVAEPVVALALGDQWMPVVPVIQVFAPIGAIATMTMPVHAVVLALGRPRPIVVRDFLIMIFSIPIVVMGALWFGLMGAVFARMLTGIAHTLLNLEILKRTLGISITAQLLNSWRSLASIALMVGVVSLAVPLDGAGSTLTLAAEIAGAGALGALTYLAAHALLWVVAGKPLRSPESFLFDQAEAAWRKLASTAQRKVANP